MYSYDNVMLLTVPGRVPSPQQMCTLPQDICLIIDASQGIRNRDPSRLNENWQYMLQFASSLVEKYNVGMQAVRIGAVVFSDRANLEFELNRYSDTKSVMDAINRIRYTGRNTNMAAGIEMARQECFRSDRGDRQNIQNLAILITPTDGPRQMLTDAIRQSVALMTMMDTRMVTVGITNDMSLLSQMSSMPQADGRDYYRVDSFQNLQYVSQNLVQNTCGKEILGYRPQSVNNFSELQKCPK